VVNIYHHADPAFPQWPSVPLCRTCVRSCKRFYQKVPDDFDNLQHRVYAATVLFFRNRFHLPRSQNAGPQGIGCSSAFNNSTFLRQRRGRLLGISELPPSTIISMGRIQPQANHEFGHQFIAFLNNPILPELLPFHTGRNTTMAKAESWDDSNRGCRRVGRSRFPCLITKESRWIPPRATSGSQTVFQRSGTCT
jgi:hypothetical protein